MLVEKTPMIYYVTNSNVYGKKIKYSRLAFPYVLFPVTLLLLIKNSHFLPLKPVNSHLKSQQNCQIPKTGFSFRVPIYISNQNSINGANFLAHIKVAIDEVIFASEEISIVFDNFSKNVTQCFLYTVHCVAIT